MKLRQNVPSNRGAVSGRECVCMRMTQKQIVEYNRLERGGQTRGNVLEVPRNEVLRAVLTKDVLAVLTEGLFV